MISFDGEETPCAIICALRRIHFLILSYITSQEAWIWMDPEWQVAGDSEDGDSHAIVVPPNLNGGKRVHPLPYDSSLPGMDLNLL